MLIIISLLPVALSLLIALSAIVYFDVISFSMPLVLGIIAGGLVHLDNRLSGKIKNLIATLTLFSFTSLLVQISLQDFWFFAFIFCALTFALTFLGSLGQRFKTIAFGGLAVAIYTALSYQKDLVVWLNPLLIFLGALTFGILSLLTDIIFPYRPVQESLNKAWISLANYFDVKAQFFDPDQIDLINENRARLASANEKLIQDFNLCRQSLFYRSSIRFARQLNIYFTAQDIHEKISSININNSRVCYELKHSDFIYRVKNLLQLQAIECRRAGQLKILPPRLDKALFGLNESLLLQRIELSNLKRLVANLTAINHLLTNLNNHSIYNDVRIQQEELSWRKLIPQLSHNFNLQNSAYRHALRLTVLMAISFLIIKSFNLNLGYWILLTILFVCQPNFNSTRPRINQRIIGTLLGVLASLFIPFIFPSAEAKLWLMAITTLLFFHFRTQRYSYSTFFITVEALTAFSFTGMNLYTAAPMRALDTLIGALLSWFAVRYLWADWQYLRPQAAINRARQSLNHYLYAILTSEKVNLAYRIARREAHENVISLSQMLQEASAHDYDDLECLQQAQENAYRQLSYISALGAYRSEITENLSDLTDKMQDYLLGNDTAKDALLNIIHSLNDEFLKEQLLALIE